MASPRDLVVHRLSQGQRTIRRPSAAEVRAAAPVVPDPAMEAHRARLARIHHSEAWRTHPVARVASWVGFAAATGLSYDRNHRALLAAGHGFIWPVYLAYRGIQAVSNKS